MFSTIYFTTLYMMYPHHWAFALIKSKGNVHLGIFPGMKNSHEP